MNKISIKILLVSFIIVGLLFYYNIKDSKIKNFFANDHDIGQLAKKFETLFSDSVIVLDEWKIYELQICCNYPIDFKVKSFKEIKLDKFDGYKHGELRVYDPFIFYQKKKGGGGHIKNLLYEACYFNLNMKYQCTINLAKIVNDIVAENKIVHDPEHKISYSQVVILEDNKVFVSLEETESKDGFPGIYEIKENKFILINKPIEKLLFDTTYFYYEGIFYAFGTDRDGNLRLYYGKDPREGKFSEHRSSPITNNPKKNRMAGNIIKVKNKIYRFAMKNDLVYGEAINLIEINTLNQINYEETFLKEKLFSQTFISNETAYRHHVTFADKNTESKELKIIITGSNFWPMSMHAKKMTKIKRD